MTEAEWITTKLPQYMLNSYPVAWDERKVRLFWCACLRRAWDVVVFEWDLVLCERIRRLVDLVERNPANANGELDAELEAVWEYFRRGNYLHLFHHPAYWVLSVFVEPPPKPFLALVGGIACEAVHDEARHSKIEPYSAEWRNMRDEAEAAEKDHQCRLIREVFGNPFRPVAIDPSWLTSDVLLIARGIYDEQAFDRMPILADALQDAGCDNGNVLDHCREPGEHVRGCWVPDLVLDKSGLYPR